MRQLLAAGLMMPAGLRMADPPAVARLGAAATSAASDAERQAASLAALGTRMQAGAWVSAGGTAFVEIANEHGRRVTVVAKLMRGLGAALNVLAAELASAQADALGAIAKSQRLDLAAEELNQQVRAQHALLPQDPDSLLISDPRADELALGQSAAAGMLSGAEARAQAAWGRARGAFDALAYTTPAMQQQMANPHWDPASSVGLSASAMAAINACGPMDELGLPAGGVITGPDGRSYPLVVKTARDTDGTLLVTSRENPKADTEWNQLAVRYGHTKFGEKADTWEKVAVAVGGIAGAGYPAGSTFTPALLDHLHPIAGGGAYVTDAPIAPNTVVNSVPGDLPQGLDNRLWVSPRTGVAAGTKAAVPDAIGLVNGAISGVLVATRMDNARTAAYRVTFEETAAGDRRARLELDRVLTRPGKTPVADVQAGYVNDKGELAATPVTGEDPQAPPIITPPRQ